MFKWLKSHLSLADLFIILIAIIAIVISGILVVKKEDDRTVYIYKNNQLIGVYPLQQDQVIKIDKHNTIEIKDSKVRMLYSDCPNQNCVRQGWGDILPIICLPNKVVVEIHSKDSKRPLIVQ
ncbi:MAG: NusG domain II-containing protein [Candidatus Cloacimonadaceae bacterium]|jgi:hypothetical protein|nr:NusG domain II-containing protein [Candidatus Cloacimonadota bacterium]MDD5625411.1 NusG domain II-containing protein [Candidatus Cloacimonadota bacterium]MDY0112439.1 NusG domain II-containing protein [Candidatus Syntrophosphaera sp.]